MPRKSNLLQEYVGKEDGCLGGKKKQNKKKKEQSIYKNMRTLFYCLLLTWAPVS